MRPFDLDCLLSFGFAPTCESRFLATVVRTRLQFVVLTGVAIEKDDLLFGFTDFRHGVWPSISGARLIALAFWPHDAEASASSGASASCYGSAEDIGVLAIVVAKLKFRKVQRQILLGHMMEAAHNATLEQRPERFEVVRVDLAAHILARAVLDGFVRNVAAQIVVGLILVRSDERHFVVNDVADETRERASILIADDAADHVSFARDRAEALTEPQIRARHDRRGR